MLKKSISILLAFMMIFSVAGASSDITDIQVVSDALVDNLDLISSDADITSDAVVSSDSEKSSEPLAIVGETDIKLEAQAATGEIFSLTFDTLEAGKALRNQSNISGTAYTRSYFFDDEVDTSSIKGSVSQSSVSSVTVEQRLGADNALKFLSKYELNGTSRVENFISIDNPLASVASTDILHFGFDFMTEDMNLLKSVSFKTTSYGWAWDFLKFNTDATITLWGKYVDNYCVNTWYKVDIYYDIANNAWYLFINDNFAEKVVTSVAMTDLITMRLEGTFDTSTDAQTVFWADNINLNLVEASALNGADKPSFFETITFANSVAGTKTVDSSKLSFGNYDAANAVKFNPVAGKFGKSSDDKAMNICNDDGYYSTANFGYFDYSGYDSTKIVKGAKVYYSTLFAIDDNTSNSVWFMALFQDTATANRRTFFEVSADGNTVKVFGQTQSDLTIAKKQWYKLEFVITVGEDGVSNNTLDVYLNGKKLNSSALSFSAKTTEDKLAITTATIRSASYVTSGTASTSDAGYVEGYKKPVPNSYWLDDITSAIYPADQSVITSEYRYRNANSSVAVYDDRIENVGTLTLEDFTTGSYMNQPYYYADATGKEITDLSVPAKGKIMVIRPLVGGDIYIPIYHIPYPADYTDPTVEITSPSDGSTFVYGFDENVTVIADISSYRADDNVVTIYIDGDAVQTFTAAPYEYVWTIPEVSGAHTIKAEITDYYGTVVQSSDVTVNIRINEPPTVTFDGIDAENNIYIGDDFAFALVSDDVDGTIAKTELYINNELYDTFTDASKQYDIDFTENGRHILKAVTYDELGKSGTAECVVNVLNKTTVDVGSINFEGYATGKVFTNNETISNATFTGSALTFAGERGKKEIATANGNNFLKVGVTAETYSGSSNPYVAAAYMVSNAVIEYETDIYFSRNDITHTANLRGDSKAGSALHMYGFKFDNEGNVMVQNGGTYADIGDYSAGTWYRLKVKMDIPNHKLDLSLENLADSTDKCEAIGYNFQYSDYYKLQHIRIEAGFTAEMPGYIGYDNMVLKYTATYPSISGFTDNNDTPDAVAPNAESLHCVMSEAVGEITKDDIILENEYGEVTVESVTVNGTDIIVTPKDGFVSSANYKLTIKSSAPLADGSEFGFDTKAVFTTKPASLDVVDGSFTSDLSGITFVADMANTTSQSKTVTLVTAIYNGDTLLDVYSKTVTLSASGDVPSDTIPVSSAYTSVKAFVITDWATGVPLSAKTFSFNK